MPRSTASSTRREKQARGEQRSAPCQSEEEAHGQEEAAERTAASSNDVSPPLNALLLLREQPEHLLGIAAVRLVARMRGKPAPPCRRASCPPHPHARRAHRPPPQRAACRQRAARSRSQAGLREASRADARACARARRRCARVAAGALPVETARSSAAVCGSRLAPSGSHDGQSARAHPNPRAGMLAHLRASPLSASQPHSPSPGMRVCSQSRRLVWPSGGGRLALCTELGRTGGGGLDEGATNSADEQLRCDRVGARHARRLCDARKPIQRRRAGRGGRRLDSCAQRSRAPLLWGGGGEPEA